MGCISREDSIFHIFIGHTYSDRIVSIIIRLILIFRQRTKHRIKKTLQFFLNPRLLLCLGIAWLITNGWSYLTVALGTYFELEWLIAASGAYLAFLWLPISPEKLVTIAIAITLLRFLFPEDKKTLAVLHNMRLKIRKAIKKKKKK